MFMESPWGRNGFDGDGLRMVSEPQDAGCCAKNRQSNNNCEKRSSFRCVMRRRSPCMSRRAGKNDIRWGPGQAKLCVWTGNMKLPTSFPCCLRSGCGNWIKLLRSEKTINEHLRTGVRLPSPPPEGPYSNPYPKARRRVRAFFIDFWSPIDGASASINIASFDAMFRRSFIL